MVKFFMIKVPIIMIMLIVVLRISHWAFDDFFRYEIGMKEKIDSIIGKGLYEKICDYLGNICFVLCLIFIVYVFIDLFIFILML